MDMCEGEMLGIKEGQPKSGNLETRYELRLCWFGQVERKDTGYTENRVMTTELTGRRQGETPKRRFPDMMRTGYRQLA